MTKQFPYHFHPEASLPGDGENLLSQVHMARVLYGDHPNLRAYMVNDGLQRLLDCCDRDTRNYPAREVRYWMLMAHVNTQDKTGLRKLLNYWWDWDRTPAARPKLADITKFNPGQHYSVLGEKFYTYDDALRYLKSEGYELGEFKQHYWPREGD